MDTPDEVRHISPKQAVALALITNELTTNSVKYAFGERSAGEIHVQINEIRGTDGLPALQMIYQDDGPGFPDAVVHGKQSNTGMWLLQTSATHTLNGMLDLHNDDGAVVTLQFPI
jgi:two-component sensor histidine kinase